MDGDTAMQELLDRQNYHKIRYLTRENTVLRQQLEDAEGNIVANKNMIKLLVEH